jgi:hypothetical protein
VTACSSATSAVWSAATSRHPSESVAALCVRSTIPLSRRGLIPYPPTGGSCPSRGGRGYVADLSCWRNRVPHRISATSIIFWAPTVRTATRRVTPERPAVIPAQGGTMTGPVSADPTRPVPPAMTALLVAAGVVVYIVFVVFIWALCAAAGRADRALERRSAPGCRPGAGQGPSQILGRHPAEH